METSSLSKLSNRKKSKTERLEIVEASHTSSFAQKSIAKHSDGNHSKLIRQNSRKNIGNFLSWSRIDILAAANAQTKHKTFILEDYRIQALISNFDIGTIDRLKESFFK